TTLGNNSATVAINSNDWDIDTAGNMSGIGTLALNGAITQTGVVAISTGTGAIALNGSVTVAGAANFTMSSGAGVFSQTYNGTTGNAHTITANSLTTGNGFVATTSNAS